MINHYPAQWKSALDLQIGELRQQFPEANIYALIDGVFDETCYPLLKRSKDLPYAALYASLTGADEETLCLSPLLIEYADGARKSWDALLKKTDGHPALSLIVTMESLEQLARRLMPWCVIDAAEYTLALAFADTRILPQLFNVLTPAQLAQFCGPAVLWQYVTRAAEWMQLALPTEAVNFADEVNFTEPQCSALMNAAEADNTLFQLRTVSPTVLQHMTPADAHASVEYWLDCANHAKIEGAPERMSLCEFGLQNPHLVGSSSLASWKSMPSQAQSIEVLLQQWTPGSTA